MKKWERLAANVATEDDPDGLAGICDEKGAGGFWDYAQLAAVDVVVNTGLSFSHTEAIQETIYNYIKNLFREE